MSASDDHAKQNGTRDLSATEMLATILDLHDVSILQVRTFGHGSRAAVEIALSNNETMAFDSVRDMTKPAVLAAELVACTGAVPKLNGARALQVASLIRQLADSQKAFSENDIAVEWGASYIQSAQTLDLDFEDRGERWAAFCHLERHSPLAAVHEKGLSIAAAGIVLRHYDGTRFVRTGWFHQHVRTLEVGLGQASLTTRMMRVGWKRRGAIGRIKATEPRGTKVLAWSFWTVPEAWEHDQ